MDPITGCLFAPPGAAANYPVVILDRVERDWWQGKAAVSKRDSDGKQCHLILSGIARARFYNT